MKSVGIVVLSWNRSARVIECLQRLRRLRGADITVIVVDNGSTDDSVARIRADAPEAVLLPLSSNTGFVGGVNAGLAEAVRLRLDYGWLLNDDTVFADDALARLIDFASAHPGHGAYSPMIVDTDDADEIQFGNGFVDWVRAELHIHRSGSQVAPLVEAGATPVLIGAALLCDLVAFRKIGPFDPRYFAYWEDVDWSVRAAKAGHPVRVVPDTTVQHDAPDRHARAPHYFYYMVRNEALFWSLHAPRHALRWRRLWIAKTLEWIGQSRDRGRADNLQACVDALWDAWHRRDGPRVPERHAPRWLLRLLVAAPHVTALVIRGELAPLLRRVVGRRR